MARPKKIKEQQEEVTQNRIMEWYMNYVLENGREPGTVYKFAKDHEISESDFYNFFGSFEGLKMAIWERFFEHTLKVMQKSPEYAAFNPREKMLSLYFTFFEMLTANRSYVLFTLKHEGSMFKNAGQLRALRRELKAYATQLIREGNEEARARLVKRSESIFSEAAWIQLVFLLKFWMNDNSPQFESTDLAIEKSVNTAFDLYENTPLERALDFGKFLWKEKMS
ncbi:TetR/AcrR family transcriptional regulator [Salinimicrobium tongyeongense]|uniref:TetR/AcrR family transcriptional regulator n=1 Tax=Salinimicrobium tongyeongense TaxID=2809707 RepID=A0ABY6NPE6_9FLAO|nr:TetR family transcriptional regulator C-terminal domain-containing protein [Salinimicrobium tongyeongense]UZH54769.1 TetR/AcrR family transcriptional regulator [Salinimicrobium tongyeongense]